MASAGALHRSDDATLGGPAAVISARLRVVIEATASIRYSDETKTEEFTVYSIDVVSEATGARWISFRRFREFDVLYSNISRLDIPGMKLPPFPSKFVKATSPQIIQDRQRQLEQILNAALAVRARAAAELARCANVSLAQEPEVLERQQSPMLSFLGLQSVFHAAMLGDISLIQLWTNSGERIRFDEKHPVTGGTLLHYAAANGHHDCVAWLLKRGCKTSARDRMGCTPADIVTALALSPPTQRRLTWPCSYLNMSVRGHPCLRFLIITDGCADSDRLFRQQLQPLMALMLAPFKLCTMTRMGDAMRVIGRMFGGSTAFSPFHRVIVIGSLSLHSEVMNAVCQIAHARFTEEAASPTGARTDGRASPTSPPTFNFTSSAMPPIACISTTLHSHMARALFWDSEFSAVRDAVACDRCVAVDAMRVTFDSRSIYSLTHVAFGRCGNLIPSVVLERASNPPSTLDAPNSQFVRVLLSGLSSSKSSRPSTEEDGRKSFDKSSPKTPSVMARRESDAVLPNDSGVQQFSHAVERAAGALKTLMASEVPPTVLPDDYHPNALILICNAPLLLGPEETPLPSRCTMRDGRLNVVIIKPKKQWAMFGPVMDLSSQIKQLQSGVLPKSSLEAEVKQIQIEEQAGEASSLQFCVDTRSDVKCSKLTVTAIRDAVVLLIIQP